MSNPLYSRIKQRLDELGMSEREASMLVAGNGDLIRNIKRARSDSLRGPRLLKLADVLDVSPEWLLTGQGETAPASKSEENASNEKNLTKLNTNVLSLYKQTITGSVPEVDARAGAGDGSIGDHEVVSLHRGESFVGHKIISEWVFPSAFLRHELHTQPGNILVIEVVGDSMSPTLESGDRLIVDTAHSRPSPDGLYIIDEGHGPMVKRLQLIRRSEPAQIRIISDNERHESYTLRLDELTIIGRVSGRVTRM